MAIQIPAAAVLTFFFGVLAGGGSRRRNGTAVAPPLPTSTPNPTPVMTPTQPVMPSTQIPASAGPAADPLAHWAGPAVASIPISGPMAAPVSIPATPVYTPPPAYTPPLAAPVPAAYTPPPAAAPQPAGPTAAQTAAQTLAAYLNAGGSDRTTIANAQRSLGLHADGIAGPQTFSAIASNGGGVLSNARQLSAYVNSGGRNTTTIAGYQRLIGATADGIVGPNTAAMVLQQGGGVIVQTVHHTTTTNIPVPPPQMQTAQRNTTDALGQYGGQTPEQWAAAMLAQYYNGGGRDHASIRDWQTRMGGITADGIVGPNTRARAAALGATIR